MDPTTRARLRLSAASSIVPALLTLLGLGLVGLSYGARAEGRVLPYGSDALVKPQLVESLRILGLDRVHRELGIQGAGVDVLVIDDWTFNPERGYVHGQAVAETIQGAAPGATLWLCKIDFARAEIPDLVDCLNEVLLRELPVRVVNLSFASGDELYGEPCGFPTPDPDPRNPLAQAIRALSERGVIFVAASGNDGFKRGLRFPACLPEVLSVGATYDFSGEVVFQSETVSCSDRAVPDRVTCYSDVAPYLDVVAPGTVIRTPSAPNFGGTSAAAPLVSGVVALMLSVQPRLTAPQIVHLLRSTGVPAFDPRAKAYFPRVDAYRALQAVLPPLPLPSLPPGSPDRLEAFDINRNGFIDDEEFFTAVDAWIVGTLPDEVFFVLIDAWAARVPVRGTASPYFSFPFSPFSFPFSSLSSPSVLGRAERIRIYDARGRLLVEVSRPSLAHLQRLLRRWANGVYLYVLYYDVQERNARPGQRIVIVGKLSVLR